jgi:iron(III) transport system substrate-binding protein
MAGNITTREAAMSIHRTHAAALAVAVAAAVTLTPPARAADPLPPATQKMLEALKLDASILDGTDEELKVPQAWADGARKEDAVIVYDTIDPRNWQKLHSVFADRYPYVKIDHSEVNTSTRRYIMPLTAFKQGRVVVDVITGISGNAFLFRDAKAFADLSELPNYKYVPEYARVEDHITVTTRLRYWCMGYNTKLVKKEDLPKTWDDLVEGDTFANKRLMLPNRPNNWLLSLWETHGEAWGEAFTRKLFAKLDPQLRKEGLNAHVKLTALGEGHAAIPQAMARVGPQAVKGAPVGFHCPEPVTVALTESGIMRESPRINGARIFLNWFISREGQIAQYWADKSVPVREELRRKEFLYFPEAVVNKKVGKPGRSETKKKMLKLWNESWLKGGGE